MDDFLGSARESVQRGVQVVKDAADENWSATLRLAKSSLSRVFVFLAIVMPCVFLALMYIGGWAMAQVSDWEFSRGFNFMASAVTGGAIVFPADPPQRISSKIFACCVASLGVGIFGFMVALLSNSLAAPLGKVLGIEVDHDTAHHESKDIFKVLPRLGGLAAGIMIMNLLAAAAFGGILGYMQDWNYFTAFKTMANVELGGGIQFHGMGVVTAEGRHFYTIVGVWSIGLACAMIAIAAEPGTIIASRLLGIHHDEAETGLHALGMLGMLTFVVLPVTLTAIMLVVACIMAPLTTWEFEGAFWAALPAVSGGAAALSSPGNPPLTIAGAVILICASSTGFFILSMVMGIGGELIEPIVQSHFLHPILGERRTIGHAIAALFGISGIIIPFLVFLGSLLVGSLMSIVQNWPFMEGFWWCVAVQFGGGMALSTKSVNSLAGMIFGIVCVAWSIGVSIFTIGVSGSPVVVPLMEYMGMTIDPEELEHLAIAVKRANSFKGKAGGLANKTVMAGVYGANEVAQSIGISPRP